MLIDLGNAADVVIIEDALLKGAVTINSGGGDDIIDIERNINDASPATFKFAVSIICGSGNDLLRIGSDADDNAVFQMAPVTFNGGLGLDTLIALTSGFNTFPPGQPTTPGFESVS